MSPVTCPSVLLERLSIHACQIAFDALGVLGNVDHTLGRAAPRADNFRDPALQCGQSKQVHTGARIELHGEVDVTTRTGVATSDRAEQRQATDAGTAQLRLVCT
jgi:hypothetical protein